MEVTEVDGGEGGRRIRSHRDLEVYKLAFSAAMNIFEATKGFPKEETYSLPDQIRRASRSVAANTAEAWRKRRYRAAFVSKLSDAETEAAETQVWIEFAVRCGYLPKEAGRVAYRHYEQLIRQLVGMIHHADQWTIPDQQSRPSRSATKSRTP